MEIAVVRPGDSLWSIASRYGVSVDAIIRANGITNPSQLVIGEALVIPTQDRIHIVRSGESLWVIARRYGVSMESIIQANNITNPALIYPGLRLRIPTTTRKTTIEVNGYLEPSGIDRDRTIVNSTERYLTYLSLFSYQVRANGDLVQLNDQIARNALRDSLAKPMMVITNFSEGTFKPEITHAIFTNRAARERLIANVINTMRNRGFFALNIDFEFVDPGDRDRYTSFLREITPRLKAEGFLVSTALAPKISGEQRGRLYEAHDYGAHGAIVDFVIIMTYEWGWSGGPPMPVAPIPNVRQVLDYAITVIPRNKIMMGAPLYGYDWTLPYVSGGPFARMLSPKEAVQLAWRMGAIIQYDTRAKAPFFRYFDRQGKQHIVWFEDARSMQAKFDLIKEYRLRGISYWVLGMEFPQNWILLEDNFNIKKYK
ncbi:LysM peptidoglycan-binding domain-containing protein [Tepidibacillus fermentans]|uniref:Spore germination protein n=1 Tax=Tepidibacillus fermentans TaxID=1281767 RepID=A0A4R3KKG3_9BACI|nr:glycoside hydrolase family 18 protein [Tepidibacillus fermentans]TCS84214.1 spore germination protein [Tepidibacillus fermentans]